MTTDPLVDHFYKVEDLLFEAKDELDEVEDQILLLEDGEDLMPLRQEHDRLTRRVEHLTSELADAGGAINDRQRREAEVEASTIVNLFG